MPRYTVTIPFAGYFLAEVVAESPKDAIEKAMGGIDANVEVKSHDGLEWAECEEWELLEHITRGNVLYASQNDARADKMKDEDNAA
jgi:hypothetical protein